MGGGPTYQGSVETTADMLQAIKENMPGLTKVMGENVTPMEQSLVDSQKVIAPQQAQLSLDLARQFFPGFTDLGIQQNRQQALGQADTDLAVLNGPGKALTAAALEAQKQADPEYYKERAQSSDALTKLFASLDDPNGGLSGAEREEVQRSLARDNASRGNITPSAESTVASAMSMGSAGAARKAQKQQAIQGAVNTATGQMPAAKSGVDTFQLTTGRPSATNTGMGQFGGVQPVGQNTMNLGQGLMQQAGTFAGNQQNNRAAQKDFFDKFQQTMQGIGSVVSCCWVFAEGYYGWKNIPWYVRASRDAYATPTNRSGYRRFAKHVVPLMQKSAVCRALIMWSLIHPMTHHAAYLAGLNKSGWVFTPLQKLWLGLFHGLGLLDGESVEVFG